MNDGMLKRNDIFLGHNGTKLEYKRKILGINEILLLYPRAIISEMALQINDDRPEGKTEYAVSECLSICKMCRIFKN